MSIINSAHAGSQINLLCIIFRVVKRNSNKYNLDEIIELCRPDNLPQSDNAKNRFKSNLNFWIKEEHKLFHFDKNEKIELAIDLNDKSLLPDNIARIVHKVIYKEVLDDVFSKNSDIKDLFIGLSAILASDENNTFLIGHNNFIENTVIDTFFSNYLPEENIPNNESKKGLVQYGHFLGYFECIDKKYIADPTRAIRHFLPSIFHVDQSLSIKEFLASLAETIPVIDGGKYREQVISVMKKKSWESNGHDIVSSTLSLAIKRLELNGDIRLIEKADDRNSVRINNKSISVVQYSGDKL